MKLHRFTRDFFANGAVKYAEGKHYVPNEETTLEVARGAAEEVDGEEALAVDGADRAARRQEERDAIAADQAAGAKRLAELDREEREAGAIAASLTADDRAARAGAKKPVKADKIEVKGQGGKTGKDADAGDGDKGSGA